MKRRAPDALPDPSTVTASEYFAAMGRKGSPMRTTFAGGRPITCSCGTCRKCRQRKSQRESRARAKLAQAARATPSSSKSPRSKPSRTA